MQSTGIIRKIDELGRIVLPKELRKFMNINTGDDFQIILENEKIILEKYSKLNNYQEDINNIINAFSQVTNYKIFVSIKDKLLNSNELLSQQIFNILKERKLFISDHITKINISQNIILEGKIVINPIVIDSDLLGGIVIVYNDNLLSMINISKIIYNLIKDKIS